MLFPGIVDSAESSLFSYRTDENWTDFFAPEFSAVLEPSFANPELESQAYSLCNGDQFCLFDIAATGRIDVGMSTQIGGQDLEEIIEISAPSKHSILTLQYSCFHCVISEDCLFTWYLNFTMQRKRSPKNESVNIQSKYTIC